MIVDKTPDRNRLELSVCPGQSPGEEGTLTNQLDWDANLRIYIPFENFLSTPNMTGVKFQFLFSSYDEMPMYLFYTPNLQAE